MPTTPNQFRFSDWAQWENRKNLPDIEYPGVYAIGIFTENTFDKKFDWQEEIGYSARARRATHRTTCILVLPNNTGNQLTLIGD